MKTASLVYFTLSVYSATAISKYEQFEFQTDRPGDSTFWIIGGQNAEVGQFPFQVSFRNKVSNKHYCGGSILTSRFLVQATHCLNHGNGDPDYIYAVVGTISLLEGGVIVGIDRIIIRDDYDPDWAENDISLLRTSEEIIFTDLIQPISLPTQNILVGENVAVIESGWGSISVEEEVLSNTLKFIKPRIITNEKCIKIFKENKAHLHINDTNICTINPKGVGGCYGDSGGPLVDITNPNNKTLIGIVSFGRRCASGLPDVFVRVYEYLDWIKKEMIENSDYIYRKNLSKTKNSINENVSV